MGDHYEVIKAVENKVITPDHSAGRKRRKDQRQVRHAMDGVARKLVERNRCKNAEVKILSGILGRTRDNNSALASKTLIGLQQQYGNYLVQRVIDLQVKAEGDPTKTEAVCIQRQGMRAGDELTQTVVARAGTSRSNLSITSVALEGSDIIIRFNKPMSLDQYWRYLFRKKSNDSKFLEADPIESPLCPSYIEADANGRRRCGKARIVFAYFRRESPNGIKLDARAWEFAKDVGKRWCSRVWNQIVQLETTQVAPELARRSAITEAERRVPEQTRRRLAQLQRNYPRLLHIDQDFIQTYQRLAPRNVNIDLPDPERMGFIYGDESIGDMVLKRVMIPSGTSFGQIEVHRVTIVAAGQTEVVYIKYFNQNNGTALFRSSPQHFRNMFINAAYASRKMGDHSFINAIQDLPAR